MEYGLFIERVKESVKEKVGEEFSVEVNHVLKNNNTTLEGIVIFKKGLKISPSIYLEPYFQNYQEGESLENIVYNILEYYKHSMEDGTREGFEVHFKFDEIKNNIIYRLINYEKNQIMLEEVPYIKFLDLAITFHCLVKNGKDGIATVRITNDLMEEWGTNSKALFCTAHRNTAKLFPPKIRTMNEVIHEILKKDMESLCETQNMLSDDSSMQDTIAKLMLEIEEDKSKPMFVMSNSNGINGATSLLYQDVIINFAHECNSDFYVLPSSIHEIILVPYHTNLEKEYLSQMVCDVNQSQVPVEDVLSNKVYLFRRETNSFDF